MRFQVLGLVGAWAGHSRIEVRGSKMRTFLAALLLARGRVVSDAQLMQLLWDERLPATAQAQIQTYASRLRSLLGAEARIERQPPGYRLDVPDAGQLDLVEFEQLAERGAAALASERHADASRLLRGALARWRGHALGGVTEHLAAIEQPRLAEARQVVLENCIDAELALGRYQPLVTELTALVAEEPLRERPRMQLMTALHRTGRTADALAVYQDFRTVLADGLGLDPSARLRELHQSILTALPAPQPVRLRRDPGPALPPEPSDFVGRETETRLARAALTAPGGAVFAITGMGGSGKTTLALRVARLVREQYPDCQLLVDAALQDDVLATVLARLGVTGLPSSLPDRVALYRRTLAGTRTLLVLDNVTDERQISPLLPNVPGCAVLITSRVPLRGVALDALTPSESVRLLAHIAGSDRVAAEPRAAQRIAELCGHLPVAIRVSGARLAMRPHWSLARLADRLADPRRLLDELEAGDLSVRDRLMPTFAALSARVRAALIRLADIGGSFTTPRAADVLGLSSVDTFDVMDELLAAQLVRTETVSPDRYRLPSLIRALALTRNPLRTNPRTASA